jgi:hypothetical protein
VGDRSSSSLVKGGRGIWGELVRTSMLFILLGHPDQG